MSSYHGNGEKCAECGLTYGKFRTGMTWMDVWIQFWNDSDTPQDQWPRKSRAIILGRWHEMKKELWQKHVSECAPREVEPVKAADPAEYKD